MEPACPTAHRSLIGKTGKVNPGILIGLLPILVFLVVFLVGPIWVNFIESLKEPGGGQGVAQYVRIFGDGYYLTVIAQTLAFGVVVTLLCTLSAIRSAMRSRARKAR